MKNIVILALCAFLAVPFSASRSSALTIPEKLVYNISWTGVSAATSVQEVSASGKEVRIVSSTRSKGWVHTFFKVDDRSESVIDRSEGGFGKPKLYRTQVKEGNYRVLKEAQFDPQNLKVEMKDQIKKTEKTEQISTKTFDTLSSIYYLRSLDLEPGKTVNLDIYDCKRLWKAEVKVLRREEVETPVGKFKTVVIKPTFRSEGATPRTGELLVWVTDDAKRIPVKIATKVKVGSINATLVGGSYWPTVAQR